MLFHKCLVVIFVTHICLSAISLEFRSVLVMGKLKSNHKLKSEVIYYPYCKLLNADLNSFAATGDYSRQHALSAGIDRSRHILHASEIYHILHSNGLWETTHCGVLSKN